MTNIFSSVPKASAEQILALERASLNAWPSGMTLWDGDWCLRLTRTARSRRINSVNVFDSRDTANIGDRISRMLRLFARHDKQSTFRWTPLMPHTLLDALLSAGWRAAAETMVMTLAFGDHAIADDAARRGDVKSLDLADWIGKLIEVDPSQRTSADAMLATLGNIAAPSLRLYIESGNGVPAATAYCVADGDYVGLFLVGVAKSERRRGLATTMLSAALQFGAELGATTAWLQVEADNAPAVALYAKAGFRECYRYIYLQPGEGS